MSCLLKGLLFDVRGDRGKILFTTENLAMIILTERFLSFQLQLRIYKRDVTFFFFSPSHLIKSYSSVQKCHFNISTHSCSVWLLWKKEKVLCIPK